MTPKHQGLMGPAVTVFEGEKKRWAHFCRNGVTWGFLTKWPKNKWVCLGLFHSGAFIRFYKWSYISPLLITDFLGAGFLTPHLAFKRHDQSRQETHGSAKGDGIRNPFLIEALGSLPMRRDGVFSLSALCGSCGEHPKNTENPGCLV